MSARRAPLSANFDVGQRNAVARSSDCPFPGRSPSAESACFPQDHETHDNESEPRNRQALCYVQAVVKNTFIEVLDHEDDMRAGSAGLTRSASDSELSGSSSEEKLHFWLPQSQKSKGAASSAGSDIDRGNAGTTIEPPLPEVPSELPERNRSGVSGRQGNRQKEGPGMRSASSTEYPEIPMIVQQIHEESGTPIAELLEAHAICDLSLVPRHIATGVLLSVGSIKHSAGECTPCLFHPSKLCHKGVTCLFCHVQHRNAKSRRYRAPKRTRDKMREAANQTLRVQDAECSSDDEVDAESASSPPTASASINQAASQDRGHDKKAEQPDGRAVKFERDGKMQL